MQDEMVNESERGRAFTALIERELPRLRAVAYRFLGNAHDADEVIQNALLKAWQKFGAFRQAAKLSSWVYRIVVNECYDIVRRRRAEEKKLKAYAQASANEGQHEPPFSSAQLARLRRAIAALPELYRLALTVAVLGGLTTDEAAERLGCSANTLYQRIHKAKALLKAKMERA